MIHRRFHELSISDMFAQWQDECFIKSLVKMQVHKIVPSEGMSPHLCYQV